jgi:hypothetical protein
MTEALWAPNGRVGLLAQFAQRVSFDDFVVSHFLSHLLSHTLFHLAL